MSQTRSEERQALAARGALEGSAHISLPPRFRFDQVDPVQLENAVPMPPPDLGALAAFVGTWTGSGFNTIFRPESELTPTPFPTPAGPLIDNVLELNLTEESLAFSPSLGSVPNRGMVQQADIFLNGVPYLQTISDVTSGQPVGIHVEPGLWMAVPASTEPAEPSQTLVRMGSIPHGATILAQGSATTTPGPPTIPAVDITPFFSASGRPNRFPSQDATAQGTPRIPQDLTGIPITQNMLDDPNSVLRDHIARQRIKSTTTISISTAPPQPLFGGGAENIAFLLGAPDAITAPNTSSDQNAQVLTVSATFWIETVEHDIVVRAAAADDGRALELRPEGHSPGVPAPRFVVPPPVPPGPGPHPLTIRTTQIQYSQTVLLNFGNLTWPHVSVATLVPAEPITITITRGWPA